MIEIKKGDKILKVSEGSYKLYFEKAGYKKVVNAKAEGKKPSAKAEPKTEPKAEPKEQPKVEPKEENKNPTSPLFIKGEVKE